MPVNILGCEDGIVRLEVDGAPDADELIAAMEQTYPSYHPMYVIWNFRGGSLSAFDAADFIRVADTCARLAPLRGEGAKTAVLCGDLYEVKLIKAFNGIAASRNAVPVCGFERLSEAMAWLSDDVDAAVAQP